MFRSDRGRGRTAHRKIAPSMSRLVLSFAPRADPDSDLTISRTILSFSTAERPGAGVGQDNSGRRAAFRMSSRHRPEEGGDSPHETPTNHADLFVGRRLEVDELVAAMLEPGHVTVSIGGVSGVGKTALAREVARRLRESGCEISWLDLSGTVIALGLEAALARSLGTETLDPTDLRLALRTRQVVLVIDGADRFAADIVSTCAASSVHRRSGSRHEVRLAMRRSGTRISSSATPASAWCSAPHCATWTTKKGEVSAPI